MMTLPKRRSAVLVILLVMGIACTKTKPPEPTNFSPDLATAEHLEPRPVSGSQAVLHKTFRLQESATFPFEIPAHAVQPHLHGLFQSFAGTANGTSDETANISFLILNEEQNADLVNNHSSDSLFVVEASHNQAVNFDLPPSTTQPVKYYLVFRNPDGSKGSRVVEASFKIEF